MHTALQVGSYCACICNTFEVFYIVLSIVLFHNTTEVIFHVLSTVLFQSTSMVFFMFFQLYLPLYFSCDFHVLQNVQIFYVQLSFYLQL
jgi:hypothetical protein